MEASTERELTDDDNDQHNINTVSSLSSIPTSPINVIGQKDTSFCGSGRIGSISSASSLGRSSPSLVLQLLWLCLIFIIFLPANALRYNLASWYPIRFLRLIAFILTFSVLNPKRIFDDLCTIFSPQSVEINWRAERYLLFICGMPRRTRIKCHCRGWWWWWRSWRKCSSRHFRWKFHLKVKHHSRTRSRFRLRMLDKGTIASKPKWVTLTNCLRRFPISLHRFTRTLRLRLVLVIYSRISKRNNKRPIKEKLDILEIMQEIGW